MRSSFTPEEVDQIEEKAYGVGESVGRRFERDRIIALLEKRKCPCSTMVCVPVCPHTPTIDELIVLIKGDN